MSLLATHSLVDEETVPDSCIRFPNISISLWIILLPLYLTDSEITLTPKHADLR